MDIIEFVNKSIFPLAILMTYLLSLRYGNKLMIMVSKHTKNRNFKKDMKILFYNFKIRLENPIFTIFAPIIMVLIMDILIMLSFKTPMLPYDEPMWFLIAIRGIIGPIAEEIFFRGVIFGFILLSTFQLFSKNNKNNNCKIWAIIALLIQSLIFAFYHNNPSSFNWVIRILSGFLYGSLYLLNKRNLLPAIIAHMAHNLFITLA